ncbi:MAG: DUF2019 domain-containing protein [Firmicutes bacterium]|nr:DUF2019 domain-containing protein [Bacillota bacterium]
MKIKELLNKYIEASINYGKSMDNHEEPKVSNRYYKQIHKAYIELLELGNDGIEELSILMDHELAYVRIWAALHLLDYDTDKAIKTLFKIKSSGGRLGYSAKMIIKEWKKKQRKAQWHYLVEPTPKNLTRFGPESLHNIFNLIKIPKNIHVRISKHYSSKINGETVAKRLEEKSYIYQYLYGVKTWIQAMFNRL